MGYSLSHVLDRLFLCETEIASLEREREVAWSIFEEWIANGAEGTIGRVMALRVERVLQELREMEELRAHWLQELEDMEKGYPLCPDDLVPASGDEGR